MNAIFSKVLDTPMRSIIDNILGISLLISKNTLPQFIFRGHL